MFGFGKQIAKKAEKKIVRSSGVVIEGLESREFFSATPVAAVKAAAPAPLKAVVVGNSTIPTVTNLVGTWTGETVTDVGRKHADFSINMLTQRNVTASGKFTLGANLGNNNVTSSIVTSRNNVRVLIVGNGFQASFTGYVAGNGTMMVGRYAYLTKAGWKTGTFTLKRA